MKSGSALLSLVVGMLIASIVFMVLINSLRQFISIDTLLNNNIDQTKRFIVAFQQLEKDLAGACVVHQATLNKKKDSKKEITDNLAVEKKKEEKKPLKECFLFNGKPTEQVILSFITSNGKEPHWPKQAINNASFLKRITYSIERDPKNKVSFCLMRHENADFTFKKSQKNKATVLLDHIASLSLSASYKVHAKEKKTKAKPDNQISEEKVDEKEKIPTVIFKKTEQWNDSFVYEQEDEFVSRIPDTIFITYELFDNQYKKRSHYKQTITLVSNGFYALTRGQNSTQQIPIPPSETEDEPISIDPFGLLKQQPNMRSQIKGVSFNQAKIGPNGIIMSDRK